MHGKLIIAGNHVGGFMHTPEPTVAAIWESKVIYAESPEIFNKQCNALGVIVSAKVMRITESDNQIYEILEYLKSGIDVLLITESGYPTVADPGSKIIKEIINNNIQVSILPGPSIGPMALAMSGIDTGHGYLVKELFDLNRDQILFVLNNIKYIYETMVFLLKDYMLITTMVEFKNIFGGNRDCSIVTDIMMPSQKILNGTIDSIIDAIYGKNIKDIFSDEPLVTVIVAGNDSTLLTS